MTMTVDHISEPTSRYPTWHNRLVAKCSTEGPSLQHIFFVRAQSTTTIHHNPRLSCESMSRLSAIKKNQARCGILLVVRTSPRAKVSTR